MKHPGNMVRILLAALRGAVPVVALVAGGCLVPQELDLYVDPDIPNRPPVIDLMTVEPKAPVACISGLADDSTALRVEVRDPDGALRDQPLSVRWFIDYDLDPETNPLDLRPVAQETQLLPLAVGSDVYAPEPLSVDQLRLFRLDDGTHTVEVVVSDGFDDGGLPRNRAALPGRYTATHRWTIVWRSNTPCE